MVTTDEQIPVHATYQNPPFQPQVRKTKATCSLNLSLGGSQGDYPEASSQQLEVVKAKSCGLLKVAVDSEDRMKALASERLKGSGK